MCDFVKVYYPLTRPKICVWAASVFFSFKKMYQAKGRQEEKKRSKQYFCTVYNKNPLLISTPLHFNSLITKPDVGMPKPSSSTQNYAKITCFLHCPSKTSLKSENNGTILWWQFHNYYSIFFETSKLLLLNTHMQILL